MKNLLLLCITFCVVLAFVFPKVVTSNPTVTNDNTCGECHDFTSGSDLHNFHNEAYDNDCSICHDTDTDPPPTSNCVVCHDPEDEEGCTIINFHEDAGLDCLSCHIECDEGVMGCRQVQLEAQQAVVDLIASGGHIHPKTGKIIHGRIVSTAAKVVSPYVLETEEITAECASCIMNQFARRIPIEEQEPCGP